MVKNIFERDNGIDHEFKSENFVFSKSKFESLTMKCPD